MEEEYLAKLFGNQQQPDINNLMPVDPKDVGLNPEDMEVMEEEVDKEVIQDEKPKKPIKKEKLMDIDPKDLGQDDDDDEPKSKKPKTNEDVNLQEFKGKKTKGKASTINYKDLLEESKKRGVFTVDIPEDFSGDEDSFIKLVDEEIVTNVKSTLKDYDNKYNGLLSYLENGGDISKWIKTHEENNFDEVKDEDAMNNDSLKEKAYTSYYKGLGMDDKMIQKQMKRAKDLEEFDDDVKDILPKIKELSKRQKDAMKLEQETVKKREVEQNTKIYNDVVTSSDKLEEFAGLTISKKMREEIKKLATGNDIWKELGEDPVKARVNLAALKVLGLLDGKADNKLAKGIETNKTKELKNRFINNGFKGDEVNATPFEQDTDNTVLALQRMFEKDKKRK